MKTLWQARSGAVLIFALLVLVVGATILGGIAQLAVTQTLAGQTEWESAARRIRLENSRAMARQYIMSQMWRGYGQLPQATMSLAAGGGLGGFAITNVEPPFGYWLSMTQGGEARINPFNLFERGGFQSAWASGNLVSTTNATNNTVAWGFQIRTRSPVVAGFAYVNQRPTNNSWAPVPRMNMHQPSDYAVGFTNLPRMPVSSVTNTNTGDTNGFLGFLSLPIPTADFDAVLATRALNSVIPSTNDLPTNSIRITIDLNIYDYGSDDTPRFYEVPYRMDYTNPATGIVEPDGYARTVAELVLTNAAGSGKSFKTNAVQVRIPDDNTGLTRLVLAGNNTRQVYLYRQGANTDLAITNSGTSGTFRIGMSLDCNAIIRTPGALTIKGGIRTGKSFTQPTGTLTLVPDNEPTVEYDAVADRMMWLEDQRAR